MMQSLRCVYSPAMALRRVFLPHLEATTAAARPALLPPPTCLSPRLFSNTSVRPKLFGGRKKAEKAPTRKPISRFPTDNAIPYKWVQLSNPDGTLAERQRTVDVLRGLDRSKYTLAMVAPPVEPKEEGLEEEEGREEEEGQEEEEEGQDEEAADPGQLTMQQLEELAPVCRIIDKQAYAKAEDERQKEWRRKQKNLKELEINWAIDWHDLKHRLDRFLEFLEKGKRVEVTLARKRKSRPATPEEANALVERFLECAAVVPAKCVTRRGQFPKMMMLAFEQNKLERQQMDQRDGSAKERYEALLESQKAPPPEEEEEQ